MIISFLIVRFVEIKFLKNTYYQLKIQIYLKMFSTHTNVYN
jgi:hypothetical protein